jgi:hypothetical protein
MRSCRRAAHQADAPETTARAGAPAGSLGDRSRISTSRRIPTGYSNPHGCEIEIILASLGTRSRTAICVLPTGWCGHGSREDESSLPFGTPTS